VLSCPPAPGRNPFGDLQETTMNPALKLNVEHLRSWIDKSETQADEITPQLVRAYRATVFDEDAPSARGERVPQGLHWCVTPHTVAMHQLGADGHPARGGFLPPVPLPRRMWAGSRVRFLDDLRVGDEVVRRSTVKDVTVKEGRSGTLCFVVVRHEFSSPRGAAVEEEQDIVYREAQSELSIQTAADVPAAPVIEPGEFHRLLEVSPPLLFRYSALTFNGHRIHYDRRYATEVEHYGGLVVHGPLQAALLLALAATMRSEAPCAEFAFRGVRPLLDTEPCVVNGAWAGPDKAELWTGPQRAAPNLQATAIWR
jgi:3-methylfumaryl-CoA hydratase